MLTAAIPSSGHRLNCCYVMSIIFKNIGDYHTNYPNHSLALAGATWGQTLKAATHFMSVSCCFCTLIQHHGLNSPFHCHENTQIEADTLYLAPINPGNQDQEPSAII